MAARPRALAALLGVTRARILVRIAVHAPITTGELVAGLSVSAATVSHHTGVLRRSSLITSGRDGVSVRHRLGPLGRDLLLAHGLPAAPPAPRPDGEPHAPSRPRAHSRPDRSERPARDTPPPRAPRPLPPTSRPASGGGEGGGGGGRGGCGHGP
ncbi:ArsR/SmtB family transcription factor (plasmid) [Streptomyces sp. BI20]|uniref:ArsR/SmtB family transcription factor n=1 Tax=Streptomyces sp. BI20 TaxID=3403460 RepID=UPI003C738ED7